MTAVAKRRLEAVSQQLVEGIPDAGTFENIPKIREVAQDSVGPYVSPRALLLSKPQLTGFQTDV